MATNCSSGASRGASERSWREALFLKLQNRNRKECHCFQGIIAAHNKLFETADVLKHENIQLTVQNEQLRIGVTDGLCKSDRSGNEKIMALEMKLFRLQEELTELHRRKGENAQLLNDFRNSLQEKEKELLIRDSKLSDSESNLRIALDSQKNLEQNIQELEATNQMLKDEYQALQLAYNRSLEDNRTLQEEYWKVKEENKELVERWMKLKARDADMLNEENENFIREKGKRMVKEMNEATQDPANCDSLVRISPIETIMKFTIPTRMLTKLDTHDGEVLAVKWGPRGRHFATGGSDRKVKIWESVKESVELRGVLRGSNAAVTSVEFNGEEDLILATSNDFASRVWTVADQRLRHTLTGHSGRVLAAKFLGDSTKVVSGSHDRTIKIWDLRNLACIRTIFTGSSCNDVVTDRPGTMIISGHFDKRIRLWDIRRESTANEIVLQGKVTSLDISPDGQYLLSCVRDNTLKLLDLRMNQLIASFCAEGFWVGFDWTRAVFTPDGRYITAGSNDGTIFIWNIEISSDITCLKEHSQPVVACAWQPTGSTLASCDKNKQVVLWTA